MTTIEQIVLKNRAEELEQENKALHEILSDILATTDVCSLCQQKGKDLTQCQTLSTDCISELLKLY